MDEAIVLRTFSSTADADLAASQLRGHGIECVITSDDAGGMYPSFGGIRLLVDAAKAEEAREILEQVPGAQRVPANIANQDEAPSENPPAPRVLRFYSGLAVGAIIGALLHFSYTHHRQFRDGTDEFDYDGDGTPDAEQDWRNGHIAQLRFDRNGDGRIDLWSHYKDGLASREEYDNNFDGQIDMWVTYSPKQIISESEVDTDLNGVPDARSTYENGVLKQSDWRPNGTNVVLLRQRFDRNSLIDELRDLNGDGRFDERVQYDAFQMPISTIPVKD